MSNDPVAHLKRQYPQKAAVVDQIYTALSAKTTDWVAVRYTEKCLRHALMFNSDPMDEMRAILESWDAFGDPVAMAAKGAAGVDPFQ